jgi:predicted nuclease of predicted toxin-antitoxin system
MRFLANENVPLTVVEAVRSAGHDVAWIRTDAPGSKDDHVLARALQDRRVLVTFDKDFGWLVFRRGAGASCGVILFRVPLMLPQALSHLVVASLGARTDWEGHFSVVEPARVRMRKLAPGP